MKTENKEYFSKLENHKFKKAEVENAIHLLLQDLKSILPTEYQKQFDEVLYVAGGCIYSLFNNKEVKDVDLFCSNKEYIQ